MSEVLLTLYGDWATRTGRAVQQVGRIGWLKYKTLMGGLGLGRVLFSSRHFSYYYLVPKYIPTYLPWGVNPKVISQIRAVLSESAQPTYYYLTVLLHK